jgi:hypothetical protein
MEASMLKNELAKIRIQKAEKRKRNAHIWRSRKIPNGKIELKNEGL